jgi:flagellar protein FlgJ
MSGEITPTSTYSGSAALLGLRRPRTPEEAAKQFEEILIRQFVQVMTRNLFRTSLEGDEAPSWMESHRDTQRDVLAEVLARHLAAQDRLGIAALLLRQWQHAGFIDAESTANVPQTP